eukprot:gene6759-4850_t
MRPCFSICPCKRQFCLERNPSHNPFNLFKWRGFSNMFHLILAIKIVNLPISFQLYTPSLFSPSLLLRSRLVAYLLIFLHESPGFRLLLKINAILVVASHASNNFCRDDLTFLLQKTFLFNNKYSLYRITFTKKKNTKYLHILTYIFLKTLILVISNFYSFLYLFEDRILRLSQSFLPSSPTAYSVKNDDSNPKLLELNRLKVIQQSPCTNSSHNQLHEVTNGRSQINLFLIRLKERRNKYTVSVEIIGYY